MKRPCTMLALLALALLALDGCARSLPPIEPLGAVPPVGYTSLIHCDSGDEVGWQVRVYRAPVPLDPHCLRQRYDANDTEPTDGPYSGTRCLHPSQVAATEERLRTLGHAELIGVATLPRTAVGPAPDAGSGVSQSSKSEARIDLGERAPRPQLASGQSAWILVNSTVTDNRVMLSIGWWADGSDATLGAGSVEFLPNSAAAQAQIERFDSGPKGWCYITIAEPDIVHSSCAFNDR